MAKCGTVAGAGRMMMVRRCTLLGGLSGAEDTAALLRRATVHVPWRIAGQSTPRQYVSVSASWPLRWKNVDGS
jgi:hypothetical protein